jgi:hypothetical protein
MNSSGSSCRLPEPNLVIPYCTQAAEVIHHLHKEVRGGQDPRKNIQPKYRQPLTIIHHSSHFPSQIIGGAPYHYHTFLDISRYRVVFESRPVMVLAEKPSSCIRTTKLGWVPATSASRMHVLASHPATTPCLLAI